MKFKPTHCPTCGSRRIKTVKKDYKSEHNGEKYIAKDLEYCECPDCGEQIFDKNAMLKIEKVSPAYKHLNKKLAA